MSALPYTYQLSVRIPPRWRSNKVCEQKIVFETDFELQEICSKQSYDYDIRIWFGSQAGMQIPHHAVNVCVPLWKPWVCAKGSSLRVELTNYKSKFFANKVRLMFCGNRLYQEAGQ